MSDTKLACCFVGIGLMVVGFLVCGMVFPDAYKAHGYGITNKPAFYWPAFYWPSDREPDSAPLGLSSLLGVSKDEYVDCMDWAFGKDWNGVQWNTVADVFRSVHPECDVQLFSDATATEDFWKRVGKAYLEQK